MTLYDKARKTGGKFDPEVTIRYLSGVESIRREVDASGDPRVIREGLAVIERQRALTALLSGEA
jgi:hypothetical protein